MWHDSNLLLRSPGWNGFITGPVNAAACDGLECSFLQFVTKFKEHNIGAMNKAGEATSRQMFSKAKGHGAIQTQYLKPALIAELWPETPGISHQIFGFLFL